MISTVESTKGVLSGHETDIPFRRAPDTMVRSLAKALDALNVSHGKHVGTRLEPFCYVYRDERTDEANRQLARLWGASRFEPGWDGYDAEAPSEGAIKSAEAMIMRLASTPIPVPHASVGADGQSNLYWKTDDFYADVDVFSSKICYLIMVGDRQLTGEENIEEGLMPPRLFMELMDKFSRELR